MLISTHNKGTYYIYLNFKIRAGAFETHLHFHYFARGVSVINAGAAARKTACVFAECNQVENAYHVHGYQKHKSNLI